MALKMDAVALRAFLDEVFPQVADEFAILVLEEDYMEVVLKVQDKHLRPGGTVSGPSMFGLADVAAYLNVLSMIGPKALAVTTNCSIDFMRKPLANTDLIAKSHIVKLGRSLAVTQCLIYSDGESKPVARANLTYSLPPTHI
ncbi:PaaI family thioesterase [uncultured Planktomarina sp.]|uniref:PaaI family thioesterase n=1 Tax=uncultured Planktomarina sp. TaxID=1538529 RepID=UPI003261A3AC